MKYFKYLKSVFPLYIISGILLGLGVFSLIAGHRYKNNMQDTRNNMENINLKEEEIRQEINRVDSLILHFQDNFGIREKVLNSEKLILYTLDEMKIHFNSASIIVSGFEEIAGEKQLPVEIRIPVNSYMSVIDCIKYIESFRLPKYRIKSLSMLEEQLGGVILDIQGGLVMPAGANN
jgi:hypothetical protein